MSQNKDDAILDAIRRTGIGDEVIIQNDDMTIFCRLQVLEKHPEIREDKELGAIK